MASERNLGTSSNGAGRRRGGAAAHALEAVGELAFGTPARALTTLTLYLAAHAVIRLVLWPPSLGYDDAEQVLSAQHWSWSYRFEQPPLVTWLLLALRDITGLAPGLVTITLLRSATLAALHVFAYLAARRLGATHLAAAAAAGSLAATYTLGYLAHADLPHSTLLAVVVAAALWLWLRMLEQPSWGRTLAFALACGLGLLAKWNFVLLAFAFLVVGLAAPDTRRLVLSWRTPLIAAVMASLAGPTAWTVAGARSDLDAVASGVLAGTPATGIAPGWLAGIGDLATSILAFPQPWLPLALLVLWPAFVRPNSAVRRTAALIAVMIGMHAALVPLAGATSFPERWMIVPLLPLPLVLMASVSPVSPRLPRFGGLLVGLALLVVLVRAVIGVTDAAYCGKCRTRMPAEAFAAAIRDAGFTSGTLVAPDMHLAGNLKRVMPDARVVVPRLPETARPAPGDGVCVVLWRGEDDGARVLAAARRALGADLSGAATRHVQAPILGGAARFQSLSFRIGEGEGSCR
jgi:hypothetical protein